MLRSAEYCAYCICAFNGGIEEPVIRPAPAIEAIAPMTPFIGPEQLMRETGRSSLVRLGANESAFGPSPKAVAAMSARARPSMRGTAIPNRTSCAKRSRASTAVDVEEVLVGAGIDDLMGLVVRAFVAPGGAALTTRGSYPTFNYHVTDTADGWLRANYRADGRLDLDALGRRGAARARIGHLSLQSRQSERHVRRTRRDRSASSKRFRATRSCCSTKPTPISSTKPTCCRCSIEDRLIRTRTFSKAYGLAGARIGYAHRDAARARHSAEDSPAVRRESQRADRRARLAGRRTLSPARR